MLTDLQELQETAHVKSFIADTLTKYTECTMKMAPLFLLNDVWENPEGGPKAKLMNSFHNLFYFMKGPWSFGTYAFCRFTFEC